jgi:hypothetical protein
MEEPPWHLSEWDEKTKKTSVRTAGVTAEIETEDHRTTSLSRHRYISRRGILEKGEENGSRSVCITDSLFAVEFSTCVSHHYHRFHIITYRLSDVAKAQVLEPSNGKYDMASLYRDVALGEQREEIKLHSDALQLHAGGNGLRFLQGHKI